MDKLELTGYFLLATADVLASGTTKRALESPTTILDEEAIQTWTSLQMAWFEWIDCLPVTDEQKDWLREWVANVADYEADEAATQAAAWMEWLNVI